jgi:hypothetical protein
MCTEPEKLPSLRVGLVAVGCVFTLALLGCVTATPTAYRDAAGLPAKSSSDVEVFWVEPDFSYRRIGEVSVKACPACSKAQIENEIRLAVAKLGGDLAIVASDTTRSAGAVVVPGPYVATVVPSQRRDLIIIAGLRKGAVSSVGSGVQERGHSGVSIESEPPGSEVYIAGQFVGTSPLPDYPLPPGIHDIELRLPGYVTWHRSLLVRPNLPVSVKATLLTNEGQRKGIDSGADPADGDGGAP